jgi:hypothetical protein
MLALNHVGIYGFASGIAAAGFAMICVDIFAHYERAGLRVVECRFSKVTI